jgi:para-aminobenzoate synthetase component 1
MQSPLADAGGFSSAPLTASSTRPDTGIIFSSPTLAPPTLTPDLAHLRAVCAEPYGCWLDSATEHRDAGRSFWAAEPSTVLTARGSTLTVERTRGGTATFTGDPFETLRDLLAEHSHLHRGAAVGYLGYGLKRHIEELPDTVDADLGVPDCSLAFYDELHEFDARPLRIEQPDRSAISLEPELCSSFDRESYEATVRRALEYIRAGDIYQVNLSQRLSAECAEDPFDVYLRLRQTSPAPFAAFLNQPGHAILSSSPERFLHYDPAERSIATRPIKGTRPRGADAGADAALALELMRSEKDRAENVMIVDLLRNDLGRIASIGSVEVTGLCELETFAGVHHLTSTIEAQLRADRDVVDLLRAAFPGGSITGAPKIRAMEIIDELEPVERGIYTGAIGYIRFNGELDLNIAIRTMLIKDGVASFSVGGGIVADSDPALEYEETMHKAAGMIQALAPTP